MASGPHPTASAAAAAPSAGGSSCGTTATTATTTTTGGILIGDRLYSEVSLTIDHSLIPEERLSPTPSMQDGLDLPSETDLRILGCELIQAAGILLRLPQVSAPGRRRAHPSPLDRGPAAAWQARGRPSRAFPAAGPRRRPGEPWAGEPGGQAFLLGGVGRGRGSGKRAAAAQNGGGSRCGPA